MLDAVRGREEVFDAEVRLRPRCLHRPEVVKRVAWSMRLKRKSCRKQEIFVLLMRRVCIRNGSISPLFPLELGILEG